MRFKTIGPAAALACALTASGVAVAVVSPPTATGTIGGVSLTFSEYLGGAYSDPVGNGQVDVNKLFFIDEKEKDGIKSWYIFFDPACRAGVDATVTFSSQIDQVFTTRADLQTWTPMFGKDGVDYEFVKFTGLERKDYITALDDHTLHITWKASDPGDHIRVWTLSPVPEPETYALLLAGLGFVGAAARRRRPGMA